jgi:hypothetical protein
MMPRLAPVLATLALAACSSGNPNPTLSPTPTRDVVQSSPEWYMNVPTDPNYMFAAKSATSRDMQIAVDKAVADARSEIAKQLEVKYQGLEKRFREETGTGTESELLDQYSNAYKQVVSSTLYGTRTKNQVVKPEGQIYRAWVLMEMPIGQANEQLMSKIKANQAMYTRFRATQAFQELETEVQKYEDFKKNEQGGQRTP